MKRQSNCARFGEVVDKKKRSSERPCIVLKSPMFESLKKKHQEEIGALYAKRKQTVPNESRMILQREINAKVINWNKSHQIEKNYFDLHGMSTGGAIWYASAIVRAREFTVLRFETGRGNHSKNGIPLIKKALLERFEQMDRCKVREEPWNQGVLVVELW